MVLPPPRAVPIQKPDRAFRRPLDLGIEFGDRQAPLLMHPHVIGTGQNFGIDQTDGPFLGVLLGGVDDHDTARDGVRRVMVCTDMLARVIQHEVDHLNGVLFIDYISRLKRDRVIKKFVKARKTEMVM